MLLSLKHLLAQQGELPSATEKDRSTNACTHFSDVAEMAYTTAVVAEIRSMIFAILRGFLYIRSKVESLERNSAGKCNKYSVDFCGDGLKKWFNFLL